MTCNETTSFVYLGPTTEAIKMKRGSVNEFDCVLTNAVGTPIDIDLDNVVFTVRDYRGGSVKLQKTSLAGAHQDAANGRVRYKISPGDISDADSPRILSWVFEVRRITPTPEEFVHIEGTFDVLPQVGD